MRTVDLSRADLAWYDLVLPVVEELEDAEVGWVPAEGPGAGELGLLLDTRLGIDGVLLFDGLPFFAGRRVQWRSTCRGWGYRTVTVRAGLPSGNDTELQKLRAAAEVGVAGPGLLVQAYVDDTGPAWQLDAVYVVRPSDLLDREPVAERLAPDGNAFLVYEVDDDLRAEPDTLAFEVEGYGAAW
jgi:hypothetical protein